MCFNMGIGGLLKFQKMLKWLKLGYFQQAAIEGSDSLWAKQVGERATEDMALLSTGMWA